MNKKIFTMAILAGMLGLIGIGTIRADSMNIQDGFVNNYSSSVHFSQGGNNFFGLLLPSGVKNLSTPEIVSLSGVDKLCYKQILGYYVNPQRGNRMWPLDTGSALLLQGSGNLTMMGGLFFDCSGDVASNVYGQVKHNYLGVEYILLAGVDYNFSSGLYTSSYSGSAEFKSALGKYTFNNYVYDTLGGIGRVVSSVVLYPGNASLTGNVNSGVFVNLTGNIVVAGTGFTGYVQFSGVDMYVTGSDRNGIIVSPTLVTAQPGMAAMSETGLSTTGVVLVTIQAGATGSSLIASGGYFMVSFIVSSGIVGQTLNVYRSQDGNTWTGNTPDASCTLDVNKYCTFRTDHLTYFAVIAGPSDGVRTAIANAQTCSDVDGCICNGANIANGATCVIATATTTSNGGGGGSYNLKKDNCKRNSNAAINLPGANDEGKDYSKSYYDRDCGTSQDKQNENDEQDEEIVDLGSIENSPYSYDLNQAYLYGYANKLTLANTIQRAGMKDTMTRKDLAIMMAGYAMRVLGLEPDADKKGCDKFTDTKKLDGDTQLYVMWSCQLGLMGLDTNGKALSKFRPNELVTRAHFSAIFSRLLFGTRYDGGKPYYEKHIAGLATHDIIKAQQNPQMQERKGYVMLMMMRADKKEVGRAKYHTSAPENGALALLSE